MTANAATVRAGRSVEGLHQLRVGFRRLEVALEAFSEAFRQGLAAAGIARPRQRFSQPAGPGPRTWMCFSTSFWPRAEARFLMSATRWFALLRARARQARDAAWKQAQALSPAGIFVLFLDDVAGPSRTRACRWRRAAASNDGGARMHTGAPERRVKKRGRAAPAARKEICTACASRSRSCAIPRNFSPRFIQERSEALSSQVGGCRSIGRAQRYRQYSASPWRAEAPCARKQRSEATPQLGADLGRRRHGNGARHLAPNRARQEPAPVKACSLIGSLHHGRP